MKLILRNMGEDGPRLRIDVWLEGSFVGDLGVEQDEWSRLVKENNNGELELELRN
jgi:hypothetical protein